MRLRILSAASVLAVAALVIVPTPAAACSMCRCSDPVFSALGEGLYSYGGFQIALDWNRLNQTEGAAGGPDFEAQIRNTLTATIAYGWQDRLTVVAQIPYTFNHLTTTDGVETADAVGDPSFFVSARLWSSPFTQGLGRRAWISVLFAVKTPWGNNDETENGVRLDEHVQPGTGATNLTGGLNGLYLIDADSSIYASVAYTGTGRNGFGYKYGNNVQANVVYDRKITEWLDGLLEVNFLDAKHDQVDAAGVIDPNTGGKSLYLTPRIGVHVVKGLVLRAAAQFPVWKDLNGIQDIKPAYTAGLTYVF